MNRSTELERREWIKSTAIPALAQTPLLGGCPASFFHSLSVLLQAVVGPKEGASCLEAGAGLQEGRGDREVRPGPP